MSLLTNLEVSINAMSKSKSSINNYAKKISNEDEFSNELEKAVVATEDKLTNDFVSLLSAQKDFNANARLVMARDTMLKQAMMNI